MENTIYRAIDANVNRVGEGLRVVEDICRFSLDHTEFQQRIKSLRHGLHAALPSKAYTCHRRAGEDVGFGAKGALEFVRHDILSLLKANFRRVEEGFRCLEEYLKLDDAEAASKMKKMRYSAYELDLRVSEVLERKMLKPGLYLILTDPPRGYEKMTEMAVQAAIPAIQLRYKGDDEKRHFELARNMRAITRDSDTLFVVNDRPDIALMVEADGLHVGQEDLPVADVRRLIGTQMILGLSTHNLDQVRCAVSAPVDYIGFGPLYDTNSKAVPDPVTGPEKLMEATQVSAHPIVAIGGLTLDRIGLLNAASSCKNAAVITAVTLADDPMKAITDIHQRILEVM